MRVHISKHVKFCDRCQRGMKHKLKYGHIPPKNAAICPWKQVCVDLIGPYTVQAKDKKQNGVYVLNNDQFRHIMVQDRRITT